MTFKITLSDVDLLKNSVPIISEIIDEGIFKVNKDGIALLSPDRTMVSVTDLKILSSAFEEYNVEEEESLGLNMANFSALLKRLKTGDKLILESSGKSNKLSMTIKGSSTRKFEIPLVDVKMDKPPIDQLSFGTKLDIDPEIIEQGISDADIIGDSIVLEAGPESFKMHAKGDVSSAQLELLKTDKGLIKLEATESTKAQYPLEYMKKMIKASKLAKQMSIEFGTDYPMRMSFKSLDKMQLSFVLAPRVSED
jgi:proliferating cell nuclear antigen PCNA